MPTNIQSSYPRDLSPEAWIESLNPSEPDIPETQLNQSEPEAFEIIHLIMSIGSINECFTFHQQLWLLDAINTLIRW